MCTDHERSMMMAAGAEVVDLLREVAERLCSNARPELRELGRRADRVLFDLVQLAGGPL